MRYKTAILSLLLANSLSLGNAWAALPFLSSPSEKSQTENTVIKSDDNKPLTSDELKAEARRWGLSADDYSHYQDLMNTTPSGKWYKNSDPAEVLAINASNEADRERYAEIVAKNTHDRLEAELAMQRAFNVAWQKLYPDLKPIELPSLKSYRKHFSLESGDQLMLFTSLFNASGSAMLSPLITTIQHHPGTKLGVFIVGNSVSDKDIQDWAKQNQIPPALVQQGNIVLDHDKGRFAQMTKGEGSLPTLILNHQGQFNSVSLSDLIR